MPARPRQKRFKDELCGRRRINGSKLRSKAQWQKWREAGVLIPGFVRQMEGPDGIVLWLPTRAISGKEIMEAMERCGKRPLSLQEIVQQAEVVPDDPTPDSLYVPQEAQPDDRFRYLPVFRFGRLGFQVSGSWHDIGWEDTGFPTVRT